MRILALAPGGDAVGRQLGGAVDARVDGDVQGAAEGGDPPGMGKPEGAGAAASAAASDGRVTFVPLAAPGETVLVRLIREKARVAWGELDEIVSAPAPVRVKPPCPLFGTCGGCQWQHVALEAQRASKRQIVARALATALAPASPEVAPEEVASPEVASPGVELRAPIPGGAGYRERARLLVGAGGAIGFRARRSHDVVDVPHCLLLAPPLATALAALRRTAAVWLSPGSELDLQLGASGVLVCVRLPRRAGPLSSSPSSSPSSWSLSPPAPGPAPSRIEADAPRWLEALRAAGVVGVAVVTVDGRATVAGEATVDIAEPDSPPLRIPAGGFSQVGRRANAALIEAALAAVGPAPGVVLELYAGSGNFTRHLCDRATAVFAHDGDREAVARGRLNAPRARWLDAPSSPSSLSSPLWRTAWPTAPDTVFVDPPRGGLDAPALAAAEGARRQIVYVSCDPQTLARDARRLVESGFELGQVVALDLMPHTHHVEVVAHFVRRPAV